ncbi:MAG: hypothetical protein KC547_22020 [Anaerolineae bacterium]|nr:hypothetical protein [Anaerolineae bacterium]
MKTQTINRILYLAACSALVGLAVLVYFSASLMAQGVGFQFGETHPGLSGHVGDFVGGVVGTVWSLAALTVLFATYLFQYKNASEGSIEKTFFQLLDQLNSMVHNSVHSYSVRQDPFGQEPEKKFEYSGRRFYSYLQGRLRKVYHTVRKYQEGEYDWNMIEDLALKFGISDDMKKRIAAARGADDAIALELSYVSFYSYYGDLLGQYFRFLYNILKYLDTSSAKYKVNVRQFIDFIQAYMAYSELFLLFYNMQYYPKMKAIVEKYDLLENLPAEWLLRPEHTELYAHDLKGLSHLEIPGADFV